METVHCGFLLAAATQILLFGSHLSLAIGRRDKSLPWNSERVIFSARQTSRVLLRTR